METNEKYSKVNRFLFLDEDGVLNARSQDDKKTYANLKGIVSAVPDVKIILSTTNRCMPVLFKGLLERLENAGVKKNIAGYTPIDNVAKFIAIYKYLSNNINYKEQNRIAVIDDDKIPCFEDYSVTPEPTVGLDKDSAVKAALLLLNKDFSMSDPNMQEIRVLYQDYLYMTPTPQKREWAKESEDVFAEWKGLPVKETLVGD